jgi:uncharacterized repeat protein (TIGR03803 family)
MVRISAVSGRCILGACLALVLPVPLRGARAETVLYSFCSQGGESCTDGEAPYAPPVADQAGNLFGTTGGGGSGGGSVFELSAGGAETVLYSFCGGSDGGAPRAG